MTEKKYVSENLKYIHKMQDIIEKSLPEYTESYFMAINQTMQPRTRYAYAMDLAIFCEFLTQKNPICKDTKSIPIEVFESLEPDDIDEYLTWLENYDKKDEDGEIRHHSNSNTGKARKLACLKSFYKFMNRRKKIKNNPVAIIDTPGDRKSDKPIVVFEDEEIRQFLNYILYGELKTKKEQDFHEKTKQRDYAIFVTLFGTGLRISELTGLDVDDVDDITNTFYVHRKGGTNQRIYYGEEVATALKDYIELSRDTLKPADGEKALFLSTQGRRMTERAIQNRLKVYANEVFGKNNNFTPHKCRSTYGSKLYNETGDIYLTSTSLGHSDISTTSKYYSRITEEKKKTVQKIRFTT